MTRRFAWFTRASPPVCRFLVGMVVTGTLTPTTAMSGRRRWLPPRGADDRPFMPGIAGVVNFADVAERVNPAVVNIDASAPAPSRGSPRPSRRRGPTRSTSAPRVTDGAAPRRRHRLHHRRRRPHPHQPSRHRECRTHHREAGRRPQPARRVVGADADTDIALIKVDRRADCRAACSATPTTCGWANGCAPSAIRWPTSTPSRSAWSASSAGSSSTEPGQLHPDRRRDQLRQQRRAADQHARRGDRHQLRDQPAGDATSGSPCRSTRRSAILPQLKAKGRVSRGYIGVALRDVDPDLQQSLQLSSSARRAGAGRHRGLAGRAGRAAAVQPDHRGRRPRCPDQRSADPGDRGSRCPERRRGSS